MTFNGFICIIMKLSFHGEVDIYNIARSVFSTVFAMQDSRRCRLKKKKQQEIFLIFLIEKFRKLNNFIHHQFNPGVKNLSTFIVCITVCLTDEFLKGKNRYQAPFFRLLSKFEHII